MLISREILQNQLQLNKYRAIRKGLPLLFEKEFIMSKYRYFVFDFDLTLADSSEGILECFKHVLKEFGYPPKDDRTIYNTIGMTLVDAFDLLTDMPDNPQREDMRKAYVKRQTR